MQSTFWFEHDSFSSSRQTLMEGRVMEVVSATRGSCRRRVGQERQLRPAEPPGRLRLAEASALAMSSLPLESPRGTSHRGTSIRHSSLCFRLQNLSVSARCLAHLSGMNAHQTRHWVPPVRYTRVPFPIVVHPQRSCLRPFCVRIAGGGSLLAQSWRQFDCAIETIFCCQCGSDVTMTCFLWIDSVLRLEVTTTI